MTISLKHNKNSTVADSGDTNVVQPSDWNDEHVLTQATARLLGRVTADTGPTEELTAAQVRTLTGLATTDSPEFTGVNIGHASDTTLTRTAAGVAAVEGNQVPSPGLQAEGDTLYRGASSWARLAKGTAGQVLKMNSGATAPEWAASREVLTADRTYYVDATDGSDSNDGLAAGSGNAFATLQKAYDTIVQTLDVAGYTITISVADDTYTAGVEVSSPWVGGGQVVFQGNTSTPANCHVSVSGHGFFVSAALLGILTIKGFKITSSGSSKNLVGVDANAKVFVEALELGGNGGGFAGLLAATAAGSLLVISGGSHTISGGGSALFQASFFGRIAINGAQTFTLTGTPAFTWIVAVATGHGQLYLPFLTFSGTGATGTRYNGSLQSLIDTGGGGASYFPGNAAGSVDASSVYN